MSSLFFVQTPPLQLAGLLGACLYMANYTLLTSRILTADRPIYFCINLAAAVLVLSSLSGAFNAATMVIQVFFVCVSLCGIAMCLRRGVAGAGPKRSMPPPGRAGSESPRVASAEPWMECAPNCRHHCVPARPGLFPVLEAQASLPTGDTC